MSGGGEDHDDTEKQYDASPKKLEDARRKGDVPRSADLITTGSYAGFLLAGLTVGGAALVEIVDQFAGIIAAAGHAEGGEWHIAEPALKNIARALAPWAAFPFGMALLSVISQRALTVTPDKLQPKLSRISLLSNAKNKFGRSGLFEFAKSTTKLAIYSTILLWYLAQQSDLILSAVALEPRPMVAVLLQLALKFMLLVLAISIGIGGIDFLWQRAEHLRKNRMSRKDMTDEQKASEGDPMMKQQRRQRGFDIAMNSMLADVPDAAVVIVNPTHYAVALKWDRAARGAPVCVAKGMDEVAARIREKATGSGVPIHSDPPAARALFATAHIGQEILPEYYAPVAAAIRFAEEMRRKVANR